MLRQVRWVSGQLEPLVPGQHLPQPHLPLVPVSATSSGAGSLPRTAALPLAPAGLLSRTEHPCCLFIELSPAAACVGARLGALTGARTAPCAGTCRCEMQGSPEPAQRVAGCAERGETWRSAPRVSSKSSAGPARGSEGRRGERRRDRKQEEDEHTEYFN